MYQAVLLTSSAHAREVTFIFDELVRSAAQIFSPCAYPLGIEKQTLLRLAISAVLEKEINMYIVLIKEVLLLIYTPISFAEQVQFLLKFRASKLNVS